MSGCISTHFSLKIEEKIQIKLIAGYYLKVKLLLIIKAIIEIDTYLLGQSGRLT